MAKSKGKGGDGKIAFVRFSRGPSSGRESEVSPRAASFSLLSLQGHPQTVDGLWPARCGSFAVGGVRPGSLTLPRWELQPPTRAESAPEAKPVFRACLRLELGGRLVPRGHPDPLVQASETPRVWLQTTAA